MRVPPSPRTYAEAGVDVTKVSGIHKSIDRILAKTFQTRKGKFGQVLGVHEHYAGLIDIGNDYALALHSDGVGTKVLVAEACHKFDTIGIDCIAMNVNDVLCLGAEPIALVDYLALEKPQPSLVTEIMKGLQHGAVEAGTAIVSGETAIVPDLVHGLDLSATVIGLVKKNRIITGEDAEPGDIVLGLRSSGIHSNGLTLARKLYPLQRTSRSILNELLTPTRIYVKSVAKLLRSGVRIHGLAHITGGAYSKLKRIGTRARVGFLLDNLTEPQSIFSKLQSKGRITDREMFRTFNMGTGFLIVCPSKSEKTIRRLLPESRRVGNVTDSLEVLISRKGRRICVESW